VSISDGRGRPARVPGLAAWLRRVAPRSARGELAVALVGDATVRALNRKYRGVDRATDVLSFPCDDGPDGGGGRHLGDVVVARGVAARQARRAGHSLTTELKVLVLHGLLHLLGFDHESDTGDMARLEARLRRRGGLPAGLLERGARR
jgi:probable rRNA maturation factor